MTLLPRAAVTLLLGVAAAACTDNSPPHSPPAPTRTTTSPPTSAPTPAATTATPVPTAPAVLTQEDTGRTVTLLVGDTTQLRLSGRWRETTPTVDGTAIVLVPVD